MGKFRNYSFEKCFSKEDLPLAFHLDIMKEPYQLHTLHVKPGSLKFEYYNKYGCGLWLPTSIGEFSIISKNALLFPSFQYFPGSNKYFLFLQKWNAQNFVLFTTLHCHYWRWNIMHSSGFFFLFLILVLSSQLQPNLRVYLSTYFRVTCIQWL